MRGNAITGWALLGIALVAGVVLASGLYIWDSNARSTEASLRPPPVAPLAASASAPAPVAVVAAAPQVPSVPTTNGDVAAGQASFQTTCNPCHPGGQAGFGPALYGPAFSQRYPDNAAIVSVVRSGRGGMPAFPSERLSDTDLANIVAYLRSLPAAPQTAAAPTSAPVANPAPTAPAAAQPAGPAATPTPLSQQLLSSITPGLSTYMMETAKRIGRSWFAAQSNNWDEAAFEIREARGVLQAGAARSPGNQARAQAITGFNGAFFDPLIEAAQAGDKTRYETAYRSAVDGCNACHASQTYGAINQPFSFIRIQVPTNSIWDVYAYAR